jgi:Zn-finger nucleic acid-binding protein
MRCPVCGNELQAAERQGIELDCCPGCRGAWLFRGQLDTLLGRLRPNGRRTEALAVSGRKPGSWPLEIEFYDFG